MVYSFCKALFIVQIRQNSSFNIYLYIFDTNKKMCYNTYITIRERIFKYIMKLNEDSSSLAEHKMLVLYILNKIGKPISQKALLELITAITQLNYFYFQQFLLDLIENKYVISYKKDDELIYDITPEGKRAIELTADMIPGILKLEVDNNLKENLEEIEEVVEAEEDLEELEAATEDSEEE